MESSEQRSTADVAGLDALIEHLGLISDDVHEGLAHPENTSLSSYIQALSAWLRDSDGYYLNLGIDPRSVNIYRRLADAAHAALYYE